MDQFYKNNALQAAEKKVEAAPIWRAPFRLLAMFAITSLMSLVYAIFAIVGRMTPSRSNRFTMLWAQLLNRWTGIEVSEHGKNRQEGAILIANHRSYTDIPAIMGSVPTTFLAKSSVRKWPIIGWAASIASTIFVDRDCKHSRRKARTDLKDRLDKGLSVMVFAEGTTTAKGTCIDLKPGMFYTAAQGNLPIVPVAIEYLEPDDAWVGAESFVPHFLRRFRQKRMKVVVSYGPTLRGSDAEALKQQTQDWIRNELNKDPHQLHAQGKNPLAKEYNHEQQTAEV